MCSRLKTALLLLALLQKSAPSSQDQLRRTFNGLVPLVGSPVGWYPIRSDACIKIFTQEKTFDEAEQHCVSMGSHLLSIHHTEELASVLNFYEETVKQRIVFWIGANYNKEKQTWQWTDGSTFDFTPWFWAQSEDENETCVEMNYTGWGNWQTNNCGRKRFYVCLQQPS